MKKANYILIISILLFSCTKPTPKPENLISEKNMVNILTDMYVYRQTNTINPADSSNQIEAMAWVLKDHKITSKQFKESYGYYNLQTEKMLKIIEGVERNIQKIHPYTPPKDGRPPM